MIQVCRKENLTFNKEKCHFRCISVAFFGRIISRQTVGLDLIKLKSSLTCHPKGKEGIASIPLYNDPLSKFSSATAELYEPLCQLTSINMEWTRNRSYWKLFDRGKASKKRRCVYKVLRLNKTTIPGNRCNLSTIRSYLTADNRWNEPPMR